MLHGLDLLLVFLLACRILCAELRYSLQYILFLKYRVYMLILFPSGCPVAKVSLSVCAFLYLPACLFTSIVSLRFLPCPFAFFFTTVLYIFFPSGLFLDFSASHAHTVYLFVSGFKDKRFGLDIFICCMIIGSTCMLMSFNVHTTVWAE